MELTETHLLIIYIIGVIGLTIFVKKLNLVDSHKKGEAFVWIVMWPVVLVGILFISSLLVATAIIALFEYIGRKIL